MVGDPCRHGRGRLPCLGQTRMRRAKVLDRPHHEHPLVQCQGVAGQRPAPERQGCEAFPERRVQPLNVRGIDHPVPLRPASECLHTGRRALDYAAFGRDHPPPLVALDDLGDEDLAPGTQPWSSALPRVYGIAKGLANGSDVGHQAIGAEQQRTVRGTAPHALDQAPDQRQITLLTDLTAEPQTRRDHHGQCHPHNTALLLDAELISLHLSQITWLLDQIRMNSLALTARASPPSRNGALVKPKRRYDRLHGAPVGQQGHDEHHRLRRGAQPIEDRAFAGTEGLVTRMADEALLLLRMDTDVALARLASGRAVLIGAECRGGVHACPPSNVGERTKRSMSGPPFALQVHLPTVACGATMKEDQRIYQERIIADPRILAGKPVVKGTRIGVDLVLEELSHNPDINELLAAHPDLTRDDVQACLAYAQAIVTGKEVSPKPPKGVRSDAAL